MVVFVFWVLVGIVPPGLSAQAAEAAGELKPAPGTAIPVAERQAAWQSLSPQEQQETIRQFIEVVGPAVQRAIRQRPEFTVPASQTQPPQQVVGRQSDGVFRLPALSVTSAGPDAAELSFRSSKSLGIEPCYTRECEGTEPLQVSIAANPVSGSAPLLVQFTRLAYSPGGYVIDTLWSFGDGDISSLANPAHTYTTPGTYLASVEVLDNLGQWAADTVVITVGGGPGNQPPTVSLNASPTSGTVPLAVSFTATASDPDGWITSYQWSFGDGTTSSGGAALSHTYTGSGSYSATLQVTDNLGATASATVTIQAFSAVGDADNDGLDDALEDTLAAGFMPYYHVSTGEQAGTGFARFQNTPTLAILQNLPAVPPAVHWRVTPLFVASINGVPHQFLQVDYLTVWNRDDGLDAGGLCHFNATILGGLTGFAIAEILDGFGPHDFDQERSAALLAAPVASAYDPAAYRSYHYYTAAHEGTFADHSYFVAPPGPLPAGYHLELWLGRAKHGTYPGNPDYLPLAPDWVIYLTYLTIDDLYWIFDIPYWQYVYYLAIADSVFYSCAVERFGEQGGGFPGLTLNVGELGQPLNGSAWIADPSIASKLQPLWLLVP
jgi:PKD repeat protein